MKAYTVGDGGYANEDEYGEWAVYADAQAEVDALHAECDRLTELLQHEEGRRSHMGSNADGCWKWGPSHYECAVREIERLTAMPPPTVSALLRYEEVMEDREEDDPVERLRFFCSLAMNCQDWLDVEPFFDDVIAALPGPQKILSAEDVTETGLYAWRRGINKAVHWVMVERAQFYNADTEASETLLCRRSFYSHQRIKLVGCAHEGQFIGPIQMPEVKND